MKAILYFLIGIILGLLAISFGLTALKALFTLNIFSAAFNALIAWGLGALTMKSFDKI